MENRKNGMFLFKTTYSYQTNVNKETNKVKHLMSVSLATKVEKKNKAGYISQSEYMSIFHN